MNGMKNQFYGEPRRERTSERREKKKTIEARQELIKILNAFGAAGVAARSCAIRADWPQGSHKMDTERLNTSVIGIGSGREWGFVCTFAIEIRMQLLVRHNRSFLPIIRGRVGTRTSRRSSQSARPLSGRVLYRVSRTAIEATLLG
jgi:hypothetical protein